jgi:hypothetical protein
MNRRMFIHAAPRPASHLVRHIDFGPYEKSALTTSKVPSGQDRVNEQHNVGVSDTTFKVLTTETGGNLFVMEHRNHKKGGPPKYASSSLTAYFAREVPEVRLIFQPWEVIPCTLKPAGAYS